MKTQRRKFIEAAVSSTALLTGTKLYGTPASTSPGEGAGASGLALVLPLANAGIPQHELDPVSRLAALVQNVITDDREADRFFHSPRGFFEYYGLDSSDAVLLDESVIILTTLTDPAVRDVLVRKDYDAFFRYVSASGLLEKHDRSILQDRIEATLSENLHSIQQAIYGGTGSGEEIPRGLNLQNAINATEDDLAVISNLLAGNGNSTISACSAMAACVVGIALLTVLYVSAAVAATIAILAGVTISAAVMVAVTAAGGSRRPTLPLSFSGQFIKLDPAAARNVQRELRMSAILGDQDMRIYSLKRAIRDEVGAVLSAMAKLGIISADGTNLDSLSDAVANYANKAAGIPE